MVRKTSQEVVGFKLYANISIIFMDNTSQFIILRRDMLQLLKCHYFQNSLTADLSKTGDRGSDRTFI